MAKPPDTVWPIEEHTKAKHRILRKCLDAWLPIMGSENRRIAYIDGFAGPGVYEGGEPGSAIIALNAYLEHRYRDRITAEVLFAFIEEREDRLARLNAEVDKLRPGLPKNVRAEVIPGPYEQVFGQTLDQLAREGKTLAPTFAFVDPFGYSQASMKLSGQFLQFARCEVLIYFPLSYIARSSGRTAKRKR
jgi:three-Cys-motif partner protein